jgi:hypothetical protein
MSFSRRVASLKDKLPLDIMSLQASALPKLETKTFLRMLALRRRVA